MGVLSACEPKKVFEFFELLCSVPHGSGNTKQISDLCVRFARERGLEHYQDALNNVIIIKEATPGYEQAGAVILQGHLDMVCVKEDDCDADMKNEGIRLVADGDFVRARGTSLGGDNAIAVAVVMALLDAEDIPHPRLEAVFTVDEETGMQGAREIDLAVLRGREMINLDSEEEGVLTAGCAGGIRVQCMLPVSREQAQGVVCSLEVGGLHGGHSGIDIDKNRASASQLLGRLLYAMQKQAEFSLLSLSGGALDNVIPSEASAVLLCRREEVPALAGAAVACAAAFRTEYAAADPGVSVCFAPGEEKTACAVCKKDTGKIVHLLLTTPFGVQMMSAELPGLVQTSLNMGILRLDDDALRCGFAVRSSHASQKEMLVSRLESMLTQLGGTMTLQGDYPGWVYRKDSPLRDRMVKVYREQCGREPEIIAIHAGLECGMFLEKLPGLDCVSCGPNLYDVHSPRERLSISSVAWLWDYIREVLRESAAEKL